MYTLQQLEKQQVGLRLPKYLIEEIDNFTKEYSLNRSEIITESIKAFISEQKAKKLYENFNESAKELNDILNQK
jgi:metal-responsive CopG/Arc/MetJ family transcriptional regulator